MFSQVDCIRSISKVSILTAVSSSLAFGHDALQAALRRNEPILETNPVNPPTTLHA